MAQITVTEIEAVLFGLLNIFMGTNPATQEIEAFLAAIAPFIGPNAATSGTIPAFKVAGITFGPIPFAK